jgi:hypothetical protein
MDKVKWGIMSTPTLALQKWFLQCKMVPICDQYTIQGDLFSKAILNDTDVPTPLEDAVANMKVIDALVESAKIRSWV